jgi:Fur family ferric uptake transcriptional regulator
VLDALYEKSGSHPSADDIYLVARQAHPGLGLATVYRTLEILADLDLAQRDELGGGGVRYELSRRLSAPEPLSSAHRHHHMVCLKCGRITEFGEDLLEDIEGAVARKTGFAITDHSLRFYGYCADCSSECGRPT